MEQRVLYKEDSKNLLELVQKYLSADLIEVCCVEGIITIFDKKLQCVSCGCKEETKLIKFGGVLMCAECIDHVHGFAERTDE